MDRVLTPYETDVALQRLLPQVVVAAERSTGGQLRAFAEITERVRVSRPAYRHYPRRQAGRRRRRWSDRLSCRTTLSRKEAPTMIDEIRQFVLDSLTDMNYSIDGVDDDTDLGPAGADVESVALAELVVRVEDRFGVKFDDDESETLTRMTVGEFCRDVLLRIQPASAH